MKRLVKLYKNQNFKVVLMKLIGRSGKKEKLQALNKTSQESLKLSMMELSLE